MMIRCIYPTPPPRTGFDTRSAFKRSTNHLNSKLSFSLIGCHAKVKGSSFRCYLSIAGGGGRIVRLITFLGVLAQSEMLTASSKIWTLVAEYISYDDNRNAISACPVILKSWLHETLRNSSLLHLETFSFNF